MTLNKILLLLMCIGLTACNNKEQSETTKQTSGLTTSDNSVEEDKKAIETLVKNMYLWKENADYSHAFKALVKDSLIVGYDMESHKLYLQELHKTSFFAKQFIDNMDKIVKRQNELLSNGTVEWPDGDMTPFNGDIDAWCNCQDVPTDNNPFSQIKFTFTKFNQNEADIFWKWNVTKDIDPSWGEPKYNIRLVKEDSQWKISRMEGWDYDANTKVE